MFFDETFRKSQSGHQLGALCGVAIPEDMLSRIAHDVYTMKYNSLGEAFAKEGELRAKELLKTRNFANQRAGRGAPDLELTFDLLRYVRRLKLMILGVVCFDTSLRSFHCDDPHRLDVTYRAIFERLDAYMQREFPGRRAKLIFDDVDYGANHARATSITNFFNRSSVGRGYDTIIRTPFFSLFPKRTMWDFNLLTLSWASSGCAFKGGKK